MARGVRGVRGSQAGVTAPRPARPGRPRAALLVGLTALLAPLGAACAIPAGSAGADPGAPGRLYVADALGDTIAQLEPASGRQAGPPLPAGPSPDQVALGPGGGLLVLSTAEGRTGEVTLVARSGGTWAARPVPFGAPAGRALLAGDGGPDAVVAYQAADADLRAPRCRLALVDARSGAVTHTTTVCRPGERVDAVALAGGAAGGDPPGAVAYLAIRPLAPAAPGLPAGGPARVVAVDPATGSVVAGLPLAGAPSHLVLAPGPAGTGARLYAVETPAQRPVLEGTGGPPQPGGPDEAAGAGRLLGLDPATLEVLSVQSLARPPLALAVGPDGERAYALVGLGDPRRGDSLTELDLVAGTERPFAALPGAALDLAATPGRVYASAPTRGVVWALDRRTGRLVATLPAGRGPAGLALGHAP